MRLLIILILFTHGLCLSSFNVGAMGRRENLLTAPIEIVPRKSLVLGVKYMPEFSIVQDGNYRRAVSNLNGFYPYLRFPFFFNVDFIFRLDRFLDQDFDIYSLTVDEYQLERHVVGSGGVNTIKACSEWNNGPLIIGVGKDIFFGSSEEEWIFEAGGVVSIDTVLYDYSGGGWQFQAGLLLKKLGFIGWGGWHDLEGETLIGEPFNLGAKLNYQLRKNLAVNLAIGYEKWQNDSDQFNISGGIAKGPLAINLSYIPWYSGVDEYSLSLSYHISAFKVGSLIPGIKFNLRKDLGIVEYAIEPSLIFQIEELIRKRKRWY